MRNQRLGKAIGKILHHQITIELEKPVNGYWDGGAKSYFEFRPKIVLYRNGKPNIEWGSWGANHWFREEVGASAESHLGTMRYILQKRFERKGIKATVKVEKGYWVK